MISQMSWNIRTCKLTDNSVEEIPGLPSSKYNPFDRNLTSNPEIYLVFAAIDESSPEAILKFINMYGFLFNHEKDTLNEMENASIEKAQKLFQNLVCSALKLTIDSPFLVIDTDGSLHSDADYEDNSSQANDSSVDYVAQLGTLAQLMEKHSPRREELKVIKQEIITIRCLVLLCEALRAYNSKGVLAQMENLYRIDLEDDKIIIAKMLELKKVNVNVVSSLAEDSLVHRVNQKLEGVKPVLRITTETEIATLASTWYAPHLLSAMYMMFYNDISRGVIHRKCKNEPCNVIFTNYGNNDRKLYLWPPTLVGGHRLNAEGVK